MRPFDSVMHFLGGATVGIFFLWLYFYSGLFAPAKRGLKHFILLSIVSVVFIGVAWEIYELILGEAELRKEEYKPDLLLDFIMDFLGALFASLYAYFKEIK